METPCPSVGRKRNSQEETCATTSKKNPVCILHYDRSKCDSFTFLSETKNPEERLQSLLNIRDLRMSQESDSKRMKYVCQLIPTKIEQNHGYHRD